MAADSFPIGTIVRLKSGGPPMTVVGYMPQNKSTSCGYFNKDEVYSTIQVFTDALEKIELKP